MRKRDKCVCPWRVAKRRPSGSPVATDRAVHTIHKLHLLSTRSLEGEVIVGTWRYRSIHSQPLVRGLGAYTCVYRCQLCLMQILSAGYFLVVHTEFGRRVSTVLMVILSAVAKCVAVSHVISCVLRSFIAFR